MLDSFFHSLGDEGKMSSYKTDGRLTGYHTVIKSTFLPLADHNMKKLYSLNALFILTIDCLLDMMYVHRNADCSWFNEEYSYLLTYLLFLFLVIMWSY